MHRLRLPVILHLLLVLQVSCTFTFVDEGGPLSFRRVDDTGDTVSVLPRIVGVFSSPVIDSTVAFAFHPPFPASITTINADHDTFVVAPAAMLEGNRRYVIRPLGRIVARNGATLDPADDSLVIHTFPREQEPNDAPAAADTLARRVCATIATVSDTDAFVCTSSNVRAIWVLSHESPVVVTILDSALSAIAASRRDVAADTVTVSGLVPPFYILVTPSQRIMAGYYEIGWTR